MYLYTQIYIPMNRPSKHRKKRYSSVFDKENCDKQMPQEHWHTLDKIRNIIYM